MLASPAPAAIPVPAPDLLAVEGLTIAFPAEDAASAPWVPVVDGVSFSVRRGECVGLVGESGAGKSLTALALLRLVPPPGRIVSGRVRLGGEDLLALPEPAMRRVRGGRIGFVFQEPASALDPVYTIGFQIAEALRAHRDLTRRAARREAEALLARVAMPDPRRRLDDYPHQLSGGQRQRAMLAVALAAGPELLVADEPTTALDVTLQAQILDLLVELVEESGMALIIVSHDLGVIAETADDVLVMYGGTVVERAPVAALLRHRAHPYTQGLFGARPRLGGGAAPLRAIPGTVPELAALPPGCRFADRCPLAIAACDAAPPPMSVVAPGHGAACIRLDAAESAACA